MEYLLNKPSVACKSLLSQLVTLRILVSCGWILIDLPVVLVTVTASTFSTTEDVASLLGFLAMK